MIFPPVDIVNIPANPHWITLGDVDNDGDVECVLGYMNGSLLVCKGLDCKLNISLDGGIVALQVAHYSSDRNGIFAITQQGYMFIIGVVDGRLDELAPAIPIPDNVARFHIHQRTDGMSNVIFISTDNCVYYQYLNVTNDAVSKEEEEFKVAVELTPVFQYRSESDQLGSIAYLGDSDGASEFVVSRCRDELLKFRVPFNNASEYHMESIKGVSSNEAPAEMLSPIRINNEQNDRWIACSSLDGNIWLLNLNDPTDSVNILNSNQVQLHFFAISKFTIVDCQTMDVHKFPFNRRVSCCTAGSFAASPGNNEPCILMADFSTNLYVFHGFDLNRHFEKFNETVFQQTLEDLRRHKAVLDVDIDNPAEFDLPAIEQRFKEALMFVRE